MMRLIRNSSKKLRSSRGETLTEVLVSIVIVGLATLMLAMVMSAALRMNDDSRKAMDAFYAANNAAAAQSSANGQGSITLTDKISGQQVKLQEDTPVLDYVISKLTNNVPVASYALHQEE